MWRKRKKWLAAYTPKNDTFRKANLTGKELGIWKFNRYIKDYLRTIQSVDDGVGEVLKYLDDNNMLPGMVFVFSRRKCLELALQIELNLM